MKRVGTFIVVTFLVGGLIGFRVGIHFGGPSGGPPRSAKEYAHILDRLSSKLNLRPDERARVAEILEINRKKINQLHDDVHPKFDAIRNDTDAEIRTVLDPDQQQKFDRMRADWEARKKKREAEADNK